MKRRSTLAFVGALVVLVAARVRGFDVVVQDGAVLSPGNDPYFFRYWLNQLSGDAVDVLATVPTQRPLTHWLNWAGASLVGTDVFVAVAPVALAVACAVVVFGLGLVLTNDRRVAVLSVLLLAVAPVHVGYTSLAFVDHQQYQYLLLALVVLALVVLEQRDSWPMAGLLAVATAASAHVFGGAALTFVPVAAFLFVRACQDVHHGREPLIDQTLVGLCAGGVLATIPHVFLGWQSALNALAPLAVAAGGFGLVGVDRFIERREHPLVDFVQISATMALGGLTAFIVGVGPNRITTRVADLLGRGNIVEAMSLFASEFAYVLGPLVQLGAIVYLGLPMLVFASAAAWNRRPDWLPVVCMGWWYLALAALQARFAAQLGIVLAVAAAMSVVGLLEWAGLARESDFFERDPVRIGLIESIPRGLALGGVVAAVLLLGALFVPAVMGDSGDQYELATAIDEHADRHEVDWPGSYVLSHWEDNRLYNWVVSGESQHYQRARASFEFVLESGTCPEKPVGYLVIGAERDVPDDLIDEPVATVGDHRAYAVDCQ
jgi:dolichyl-diphosphooligosaccharide--protein glycosyltransferase